MQNLELKMRRPNPFSIIFRQICVVGKTVKNPFLQRYSDKMCAGVKVGVEKSFEMLLDIKVTKMKC